MRPTWLVGSSLAHDMSAQSGWTQGQSRGHQWSTPAPRLPCGAPRQRGLSGMPPLWRPAPVTGKRPPLVLPRGLEAVVDTSGPCWPKHLAMPRECGLWDACGCWHGFLAANDERTSMHGACARSRGLGGVECEDWSAGGDMATNPQQQPFPDIDRKVWVPSVPIEPAPRPAPPPPPPPPSPPPPP